MDIQIYGNVRPLCTGLSIWSSLHVVILIINIAIPAIFATQLAALLPRFTGANFKRDLVFRERQTAFFSLVSRSLVSLFVAAPLFQIFLVFRALF